MRKLVIIRKKKIRLHRKGKVQRTMLAVAATIGMLVSLIPALQVQAEEGLIYHRHQGSCETQGGCYGTPVYHIHEGNETEGGACFATPVYHVHHGNEAEEGGCYTKPVYHVHEGDETEGGACYKAVTHVHSTGCYQDMECQIKYNIGPTLRIWDQWCAHHQMTSHGESKAVLHHQNCGYGDREISVTYCRTCGHGTVDTHSYSRLTCSADTSVITGYEFACEKTEETIDRYVPDCSRDFNTIDSYSQSCFKNAETIDKYEVNCGWNEEQACGKIVITNETQGRSEKVLLHVTVEDMTGGKLILTENPYSWQDEEGNLLGNEEYLEIDKNGSYKATVEFQNSDIDRSRLEKTIQVENVYKAEPVKTDAPVPDRNEEDSSDSSPDEPVQEPLVVAPALRSPEPIPLPVQIEQLPPVSSRKTGEKATTSPSAAPTKAPVIKKETVKVKAQENEALEVIAYEPVQMQEEPSFFSRPAVRAISVTAGGLLLIGGCTLLVFWKKKTVTLFNDDGEGRLYCVGYCPVIETQEGYTVNITETMLERSSTNRFCMKPGLFLFGKEDGQELIVCREQKRISVPLNKEMTFVI